MHTYNNTLRAPHVPYVHNNGEERRENPGRVMDSANVSAVF